MHRIEIELALPVPVAGRAKLRSDHVRALVKDGQAKGPRGPARAPSGRHPRTAVQRRTRAGRRKAA